MEKNAENSKDQRIAKLPSEVIDQIAAGEVVERPSHLVKELVENSLDAGATEIEVEVDEGGKSITVTDNGLGIQKEDLALALSRHATSKIRLADDIWHLNSFGFRGEALASASAVSELTLISRPHGNEEAHRLVSEFGRLEEIDVCGGKEGTRIQIRKLFENVPARMKFLKSDTGETSQIKMTLKAMALSRPDVTFRFKSKKKLVSVWSSVATQEERAAQILEVKPFFMAEGELGDYSVQICFAPPHVVFGNSRNIWLFVQGRWVQDRSMQMAVLEAYRGLLMHGEFPYAAVWLNCKTDCVDVNVHPTKSQVKFQDQRSVFRVIQRSLRAELEKAPWVDRVLSTERPVEAPLKPPVEENLQFSEPTFNKTQYSYKTTDLAEPSRVESAVTEYSRNHLEQKPNVSYGNSSFVSQSTQNTSVVETAKTTEPSRWSDLHIIGQADLTYLVTQNKDKLIFIDQHAAHERVAYERLMKAWKSGEAEVQSYLIPLSVDLSEEEVEALLNCQKDLMRLGVEIDQGGPTSVLVRSAVTFVKESSLVKALVKVASEAVERGDSFAFERSVSDICATLACHSVIRAGKVLSKDEMKALLREMDEFPLSSFCPHGRPVFVEYPFDRLERDFGRIV